LVTLLRKESTKDNLGESWEISNFEGNVSKISNGAYKGLGLRDLIIQYEAEFIGEENFKNFGHNFPLLIKYLDAHTDLSVQVHPDNEMAKTFHNSYGKTEMWFIMESDKKSKIILVTAVISKGNMPHLLNLGRVVARSTFKCLT
jgi:mannose-6-phosphate isomerase